MQLQFFAKAVLIFFTTALYSFDFDPTVYEGPIDQEYEKVFGISTRNYSVHGGEILRNQNLSDILTDCGVDYPTIHKLAQRSKNIFDLRQLKAGRPYTILSSKYEDERAEYMIYEANPEDYVVFDLRGEIKIEVRQKTVEKRLKMATGVINSSLYMTLEERNLSPKLAITLSEVYAWTVDFFKLHKGDRFKIIYEEKFAEGEYIGVGDIKAATFEHFGESLNAFYFDGLEFPGYFNEDGESLRRAFLRAPVKFSRISSGFSKRRFHPVQKRFKAHLGTDYAAPKGTPILATADGVVSYAGYKKYNGNYVKVRHNGTYTTQYLHMSKIAKGMRSGRKVKQGEVIGYVGQTGLATGPHVCYRFWKNGQQVNPYKQKLPEALPLDKKHLPAFQPIAAEYLEVLESLSYEAEEVIVKEIEIDLEDAMVRRNDLDLGSPPIIGLEIVH